MRGRLGLERDHRGVVAADVVAHLGLGHRLAHLRRRPGDGVGAEVDGSHRAESILPAVPRRAADYPPPVRVREFVAAPEAGEDERIDVGVLFVGGGPAGMAGAIRLGQLLAEDPATAEALGETPIAVIDKGRVAGAHLLSGAVVNPSALRDLLPGDAARPAARLRRRSGARPSTSCARATACACPRRRPSTTRATGSSRWRSSTATWASRRRSSARWCCPRRPRRGCSSTAAPCAASRPATRASTATAADRRVRAGRRDRCARRRCWPRGRRGTWPGRSPSSFEPRAANPQVYALGVKEVWKVARPLDRVIHTLGWPLRWAGKYGEIGGSFIYPMGERPSASASSSGSSTRRALSVHDLLQEFKTHPLDARAARGRRARGLGREDDPGGRLLSVPRALAMPGAVLTGDAAGLRQRPEAEGRPLRHALGHARRRDDPRGAEGRAPTSPRRARSTATTARVRASDIWRDLHRVPQHAPGAHEGPRGRRRRWPARWTHPRRVPGRRVPHRGATPTRSSGSRRATIPSRTARSRSTSSRASSSRATAAATTSPTTSASGARPDRGGAGVGRDVPGRGLRARRAVAAKAWSSVSSRRRTACSAVRSPPRGDGSRPRRAAAAPSTRSSSRLRHEARREPVDLDDHVGRDVVALRRGQDLLGDGAS